MNGDIEMTPAEEDLRDAMKDEAAFDLFLSAGGDS